MEVFKHQIWHFVLLVPVLLVLIYFPISYPELQSGDLFGVSSMYWHGTAIVIPIFHQIYVLVCWRLELYHQSISKNLGQTGYKIYKLGFAILILLRPISLILLAIANTNTFELSSLLTMIFSLILFIPSVYLFYSVKKYFGIDRAFGEDHFDQEKYKNQNLIKKGIFKYTNNGMYVYGFLALYLPAIIWHSKAALLVAVFNHIYIWVHYYFTELPDIKKIYNNFNE